MKVVLSRDALAAGLRRIINVVGARTTMPILHNVLLECRDGNLLMTTTDLEVCITTEIPALVEIAGETTLPARKLAQIVAALPAGDVSIESDENLYNTISCGRAYLRIVGLNPEDFPRDAEFAEDWEFTIPADELRKSLCKVSYASSGDEKRQVLSGVLVTLREGVMTIVGTDGRRLALVERPLPDNTSTDGEAILPSKLVDELEKSLSGSEPVSVRLSDSRVSVSFPGTVITSKLLEGNYPNYRLVIPGSFGHSVAMPRETFATVLNRVSMVVTETSASVKLTLDQGQMEISASSVELGEAKEPVEISYEGEPIEIAFNPVFFSDPLRFLECDQLIMQFNDEFSPVAVSGDEGFLYVVMPMRG